MLSPVRLYARPRFSPAPCATRQLHGSSRLAFTPSLQRLAGPVGIARQGVEEEEAVGRELRAEPGLLGSHPVVDKGMNVQQDVATSVPASVEEQLQAALRELEEKNRQLAQLRADKEAKARILREGREHENLTFRRAGLIVAVQCPAGTLQFLLEHVNASDARIQLTQGEIDGIVHAGLADDFLLWHELYDNLLDRTLNRYLRTKLYRPSKKNRKSADAYAAAAHLVLLATEHLIPTYYSELSGRADPLQRNNYDIVFEDMVRPGVEKVLVGQPEKAKALLAQFRRAFNTHMEVHRELNLSL